MAIFQYSADDRGFLASESRRKAAEQRRQVQDVLSRAAEPTKPSPPKLERVEKSPELSSIFRDTIAPLAGFARTQSQTARDLREQQARLNPMFQAATAEDVAASSTNVGDFERAAAAAAGRLQEGLGAREQAAVGDAIGFLERYGAGRPGLGAGSELAKLAADRAAAARLPFAVQQAQLDLDVADRIRAARAGAVGQRQALLAREYDFLRDQPSDFLRPAGLSLGLLGQAGDIYNRINFLGLSQDTGQRPYQLPYTPPRVTLPGVYMPPPPVRQLVVPPKYGSTPPQPPAPQPPAPQPSSAARQRAFASPDPGGYLAARARADEVAYRRSLDYPQFADEDLFFRNL